MPGSGKSCFCKMEMGSVFLLGDDEIIVIDPMNEYFDIAETYGGTVANMSRVYQNLDYDKLMSHAFVYTNITGL